MQSGVHLRPTVNGVTWDTSQVFHPSEEDISSGDARQGSKPSLVRSW